MGSSYDLLRMLAVSASGASVNAQSAGANKLPEIRRKNSSRGAWIGVFFDGTGNNLEADLVRRHANTPRMRLRPHYQAMFDAWTQTQQQGYRPDRILLTFFETWVHDSLVGFGRDATLPSDPRIVFFRPQS